MITNAFTPQIYADYKETLQQYHLQMKLTKRKAQRDQIALLTTTTHFLNYSYLGTYVTYISYWHMRKFVEPQIL